MVEGRSPYIAERPPTVAGHPSMAAERSAKLAGLAKTMEIRLFLPKTCSKMELTVSFASSGPPIMEKGLSRSDGGN